MNETIFITLTPVFLDLLKLAPKQPSGKSQIPNWSSRPLDRLQFSKQKQASKKALLAYNKGQCNERLAQAVWAPVIAKRRLAREVGSEEKKEKGRQQPALE